jgi:hypothetical protein
MTIRSFVFKNLSLSFFNKLNNTSLDRLIDIFSITPGLIRTKAVENEQNSTEPKLFFVSKDTQTKDSKLIQIDVHRKLFNDCVIKIMRCDVSKSEF